MNQTRCWVCILSLAAVAIMPILASSELKAEPEESLSEGREWGRTVEGLALSIATEKRKYAPGEQIVLNVLLKNLGEKPVLLAEQDPLWSFRPTVLLPDGKRAFITMNGKVVSEDDVGSGISVGSDIIKPGELRCVEFVLNRLYDFTRSGKYTISVRRLHFAATERTEPSSGGNRKAMPQPIQASATTIQQSRLSKTRGQHETLAVLSNKIEIIVDSSLPKPKVTRGKPDKPAQEHILLNPR